MHHRGTIASGLAGAIALLFALTAPALAQDKYPSRPITLLLPYAAGGGTDAIARVFGRAMEEKLGGSIVIDNRPGAGGNLATDAIAKAAPDGYTLLIGNQGPMVVNPHLFANMKSDPEKTLEPIGLIAEASLVVVTGPKLKTKTLKEFLDVARSRNGEITYASASNASASHLAALLMTRAGGFKARHVAYRGAGPALNDLVGGHVDFMITTVPSVTGLVLGKQLDGLAVTGNERVEVFPDIGTAKEAGLDRFYAAAWYGLLAPKGIPSDIKEKLETAMTEALKDATLIARLRDDGGKPSSLRGAAFAAYMAAERKRWGDVVREENLSLRE
jgi:tripartite-type tricarboxylate transporter receptor subunit TctC